LSVSFTKIKSLLGVEFVATTNLTQLAGFYDDEAAYYRRIIVVYIIAGFMVMGLGVGILTGLHANVGSLEIGQVFYVETGIVGFSSMICLYALQLIGKQIVATREIIYVLSLRSKHLLGFQYAFDHCRESEHEAVLHAYLAFISEPLRSPFDQGKVAAKAGIKALLHQ